MILNSGLAECTRLMASGGGGVKWRAMALDADDGTTLPLAATNTQLGAEITTGGAERKDFGDVTITLETTNVADDTLRFSTLWTFTQDHTIWGFGVGNNANANTDDLLLRQLFAAAYDALATDVFGLDVDVISTDEVVSADSVLTHAGLVEGNKLIGQGLTPASGRWADIAVGQDDGTLLPLAQTNTALGDEILAADGLGLSRSEGTALAVNVTTTNVTDDTIEIDKSFTVSGAGTGIGEIAQVTSTTEASGVMPFRWVFPDKLDVISTDIVRFILRQTQVA